LKSNLSVKEAAELYQLVLNILRLI